jgi:hypothetical protein
MDILRELINVSKITFEACFYINLRNERPSYHWHISGTTVIFTALCSLLHFKPCIVTIHQSFLWVILLETVDSLLKDNHHYLTQLHDNLIRSQSRMKKYADLNHTKQKFNEVIGFTSNYSPIDKSLYLMIAIKSWLHGFMVPLRWKNELILSPTSRFSYLEFTYEFTYDYLKVQLFIMLFIFLN